MDGTRVELKMSKRNPMERNGPLVDTDYLVVEPKPKEVCSTLESQTLHHKPYQLHHTNESGDDFSCNGVVYMALGLGLRISNIHCV